MTKFLDNTIALPSSGRDATTAFSEGNGDVLHLLRERGDPGPPERRADFDYIVPDDTLLIENPAAVLTDAADAAQGFLDFLLTPEAQADYAQSGFRPVVDGVEIPEVEGANDPADPFPDAGHPAHDRRGLRWLGRGQREVLRRGRGHHHPSCRLRPGKHRMTSRHATGPSWPIPEVTARPARKRRSGLAGHADHLDVGARLLGLGISVTWFSLLVLIPLAALVVTAARRRLGRLRRRP